MDTNDITAGTYLLVAPFWDEYLSRPGQPFDFKRHRRGEVLDLNVADARRLLKAGAVLPHDPANPTHVVNADGTVSEIVPDPAAVQGLVIPQEQLDALREQFGIPADAQSEDLVGLIVGLQRELAAAQSAADSGQRPKSDTIDDILAWVGDDPERAQLALDGEKSTKGDKARPRLLSSLAQVLAGAQGSQGGQGS